MKNVLYVENVNFVGVSKFGIKATNLQDHTEKYFAYEDLDVIIFDNVKSYLTQHLIEKCAENNIMLLFCDSKHSPLVLLDNIYGQEHRLEMLQKQLALSAKAKSRIWHKIVVRKIQNQADCLELVERPDEDVALLRSAVKNVTEGDKHNTEAYAAREYFQSLFGKDFKRGRYDDLVNASLNYGYAIIRALIRRKIVVHGLEPSYGVNHHSTENPFNLSDDLIECYRPLIDYSIVMHLRERDVEDVELTPEDKHAIVGIMLEKCVIGDKIFRIGDAVEETIKSYLACLQADSASSLKLPTFIQGGK